MRPATVGKRPGGAVCNHAGAKGTTLAHGDPERVNPGRGDGAVTSSPVEERRYAITPGNVKDRYGQAPNERRRLDGTQRRCQ